MSESIAYRHVAVITGGGTGIGRATAVTLARSGWSVALVGRRREPLEETASACRDANPAASAHVITADVTDPDQCRAVIDQTDQHFGRLDALINNAGGGPSGAIADATPDQIRQNLAVNALAPAWLTHFAWPIFVRQGAGCVVNVSSMSAHDPYPGLFGYAAGKAACESMIRSIHNERGELNIRAFAVAPGAVETALLRSYIDESVVPRSATMAPDVIARVIADCALGRHDDRDGQTLIVQSAEHAHSSPD